MTLSPHIRDVIILSDAAFIDGGGAAVALGSAKGLAELGIRVTVVSAIGPPMQSLLDVENLRVRWTDQPAISTSAANALRQGLWNDTAAKSLEAVLHDCSPSSTVVHVHGWTKALSPAIFYVALRLKFKVVVTLHDYFSICPNGSLYLHPQHEICELKPMSFECIRTNCDSRSYAVKMFRVARQYLTQIVAGMPREVKHFITVSDFSRGIIEPHLPQDSTLFSVANPVTMQNEQYSDAESNRRFLYLGRLSPEKGAVLFASAAREAGVEAVFAGDGQSRGAIVEANNAAKLLGWLDPALVISTIRQSRVLVMPSLWYETYGLSVMEAAAYGIPAIVADTSAAKELVVDGITGLWFKGSDQASLVHKLKIMSEEGVAGRMGAAAYKRFWSAPPTMELHLSKLCSVYEQMLTSAFA